MPSHRIDRLNEDMKRELSALLRELKDPRIDSTWLSVMRTEITSDLSYAKVYIGSIKGGDDAREACKLLQKQIAGHLRTEISKRLRMRKAPELRFIADDSADYYAKISGIIDNLKDKQ